jgi:replicative superfamily II helicase
VQKHGHQQCQLTIIDEIHLLHDECGPVLESVVAQTIQRMEQTSEYVRLVALLATPPNYQVVVTFLHVDEFMGMHLIGLVGCSSDSSGEEGHQAIAGDERSV